VRPGGGEPFELDVDLSSTQGLAAVFGVEQGSGTAGVVGGEFFQLLLEVVFAGGGDEGLLQFGKSRTEDLGDVAAAELSEIVVIKFHSYMLLSIHSLKR